MNDKYKGIFPAFYACYDDEGNVSSERTQALAEGNLTRALALQNAANEITYTMCSAVGNMYAVAKAAIEKRTGIKLGGVRAPLLNLTQEDKEIVEKTANLVEKALAL